MTQFAHAVLDVPEDVVVVSDQPWMGSEIGTWYGDRRWLTSGADDANSDATEDDVSVTVAVARRAGAAQIDVVDSQDGALDRLGVNPTYPGFRFDGVRTIKFLWNDVVIRRYVAV